MRITQNKVMVHISLACLCFVMLASAGSARAATGILVMKIEKQKLAFAAGEANTSINGEIVYRMAQVEKGTTFELTSFSLVGSSVKTKQGESGTLSLMLKPQSGRSTYEPKSRTIRSEFLIEVHYPLIDRIKGYKMPKKGEREIDDIRSYTETFAGSVTCQLSEAPKVGRESTKLKEGTTLSIKLEPKEKVLGEIGSLTGKIKVIDVVIWPKFYIKKSIDIQPVFVRYTPAEGCFGGSTTATSGGSLPTLKDKSIEMWNRCCVGLNFLSPVYINNENYRILSSTEEAALMAAYDNPNAIEVYFVEIGDPVGIHGGGACYSSGTANAKVITYDANLPINLYNLAHELGHVFGLMHPPGNATAGSLMEPSGFCADNPALMSKLNCDNAANSLLTVPHPIPLCLRSTNMP